MVVFCRSFNILITGACVKKKTVKKVGNVRWRKNILIYSFALQGTQFLNNFFSKQALCVLMPLFVKNICEQTEFPSDRAIL